GWAPAIMLFACGLVLYPDGDLPSGRWRVPVGALVVSGLGWLAGADALALDGVLSHDVRVDSPGNPVHGSHPTGGGEGWGVSQGVFFVLLASVALAWIPNQIPAYRRATGVRRAQLKWLLLGAGTTVIGVVLTMFAVTRSTSVMVIVLGFIGAA